MEGSTELITNSIVAKEEPECMEITPAIDTDFMDAAASFLADSSAQNPYAEQMLKDGLSYADIDYFIKSYSNINNVRFEKIHCTCCNKHVGTAVETTERYAHPLLQVTVCENCYMFYCSGEFVTDKDGSELYCRWCGEGGQVFCCSKCPYVFCKKCISRNLGKGMAPEIECMEDWLCFSCNPCQISKQRAICWAINKYAQETKELSEFSPHLKSQLFLDYSTCCKSKRALAKAGLIPSAKRQKTDTSKLKQALQKDGLGPDPGPPIVWENTSEPQDEVICTPDIMPFEESPPSSPPPMLPMEYAPPPGIRGLDAPPNVPVMKRVILPKPAPAPKNPPREKPPVIVKPTPPKPTPPKPMPPKPTPIKTSNINATKSSNIIVNKNPPKPDVSVPNVVPTTQKITVPVQKGNTNSDEQWFGTAVIRSAEVTEYISSKVSLLAFMNSSNDVTDEKREEIYRTFQSHLDIAIAKLKNIKQNMTSSYKRLLSKQATGINTVKTQQIIMKPTVVQSTVTIPAAPITPVKPISKPLRTSARKKSISYVESSSEDEDWKQSDSDDEYSSGSTRKKSKKKKLTPKKIELVTPNFRTVELVKPVDISAIVNNADIKNITPTIRDNKIILDVINLIDDDSNDATDNPVKKDDENLNSLSDVEREEVPEIDSDISEILPDHLLDDDDSDREDAIKNKCADTKVTNDDASENKKKKMGIKNDKNGTCTEKLAVLQMEAPIEIEDDDDDEAEAEAETEAEAQTEAEAEAEPVKKEVKKTDDDPEEDKSHNENKNKKRPESVNSDKVESNSGEQNVPKIEDKKKDAPEDENMDDASQSSLPKSQNDENDKSIEKMDCEEENIDDINTNETNATEENNIENKSSEIENIDESKSSETENIDDANDTNATEENSNSMTKTEKKGKNKFQNGEHSNDSTRMDNNMSDNAVDGEIKSNGAEKSKTDGSSQEEPVVEDFEDFLSSSVIKSKKTVKDNFGDEFSKFVSNSKSSVSDEELEDDLVDTMCEDADDGLSLPPQNTLDFALGLKDKEKNVKVAKTENKVDLKNGIEQPAEENPYLDNELNVLRKLAENCINTDLETNE